MKSFIIVSLFIFNSTIFAESDKADRTIYCNDANLTSKFTYINLTKSGSGDLSVDFDGLNKKMGSNTFKKDGNNNCKLGRKGNDITEYLCTVIYDESPLPVVGGKKGTTYKLSLSYLEDNKSQTGTVRVNYSAPNNINKMESYIDLNKCLSYDKPKNFIDKAKLIYTSDSTYHEYSDFEKKLLAKKAKGQSDSKVTVDSHGATGEWSNEGGTPEVEESTAREPAAAELK